MDKENAVEFVVQGYFSPQYGWEDVDYADTIPAIVEACKVYRENDPKNLYRWIKRITDAEGKTTFYIDREVLRQPLD